MKKLDVVSVENLSYNALKGDVVPAEAYMVWLNICSEYSEQMLWDMCEGAVTYNPELHNLVDFDE